MAQGGGPVESLVPANLPVPGRASSALGGEKASSQAGSLGQCAGQHHAALAPPEP